VVAVTGPGFDAAPDALGRRADALTRVEETVSRARDAAQVASTPAAFGLLCGFFPALLDPAHDEGRTALDRGAEAARALADALRTSAADYRRTDVDAAQGFGGRTR
jgi:hypothetical protein